MGAREAWRPREARNGPAGKMLTGAARYCSAPVNFDRLTRSDHGKDGYPLQNASAGAEAARAAMPHRGHRQVRFRTRTIPADRAGDGSLHRSGTYRR